MLSRDGAKFSLPLVLSHVLPFLVLGFGWSNVSGVRDELWPAVGMCSTFIIFTGILIRLVSIGVGVVKS